MDRGTEEIRINDLFTSRLGSSYKSGKKDEESEPNIRYNIFRTDEYLQKVVEKINPDSGKLIIPENCRFIKRYSSYTMVAIEEAPAIRSIRVAIDLSRDMEALKNKGQWKEFGYENFFEKNTSPYTFMLAMPYVIHLLLIKDNTFNRGRVFFRPKPLLGLDDIVYRPPLLNISSNMAVCYGDEINYGPRTSIVREVEHIIRVFWSATFNTDYIDNYHMYSDIPGLCDYFTWQYYSSENPMFIYNADWIPYFKTLSEIIDEIEYGSRLSSELFGYKTLRDLFSSRFLSDKIVKVGKRKTSRQLVYDFCNGYIVGDNLPIYLGDSLTYSKGRIAYIDCFIGISGYSEPKFIRLKLDDKLITMKLTNKAKNFIYQKVKDLRYLSSIELPDKTILNAGDIISVPSSNFGTMVYKKIHYIRKAMDDKIEMRIGSEYWFYDAFDWSNIKKVDMSEPEIDGVKVNTEDVYKYHTHAHNPPAPLGRFINVKFIEVTTGRNGNLVASFKDIAPQSGTGVYNINLTNIAGRSRKLLSPDETRTLPEIFFIGRSLLYVINVEGEIIKAEIHKQYGVIINPSDKLRFKHFPEKLVKTLISSDGNHFHAESNNLVVDFSIGDKVVVADWKNPLEILSIKTITGFATNLEKRTIDFVLQDKHEKISTIEYVNGYYSFIKVGKIRKVTNELNGITIGTKIIAKESGISCFPKKDVNIIVAFIVDTNGEPLVLCSNGCTLWFSDLEKFELIKMKSKRWKKLIHSPLDPSKIKFQAGDILNGIEEYSTRRGYAVARNEAGSGNRIINLEYYHEYNEYAYVDKDFMDNLILDCIPNPRLTIPQQNEKGYVSGFITFHGGISQTDVSLSPYKFIDETGRF